MEYEKLKEYVGITVQMERDIFLTQQLISDLDNKINELAVPAAIFEPEKPVKPSLEKESSSTQLGMGIADLVLLLLTFVWFSTGHPIVGTISIFFLLAFVGVSISVIPDEIHNNEHIRDSNNQRISNYKYNKTIYDKYLAEKAADNARVAQEKKKKEYLFQLQSRIKNELKKSQKRMEIVYGANVLHPKYRNFVAVTYIYDLLDAKICTELENTGGAYQLFENALSAHLIIYYLSEILKKLEAIKQTQYSMYRAIQSVNSQLSSILQSTFEIADAIGDNSAQIEKLTAQSEIANYYARQTQAELHYMNRMDYLTGKNDDAPLGVRFPPN